MVREAIAALLLVLLASPVLGARLLGLKSTIREVNRIRTYTSMFIAVDSQTGATTELHHINTLPSLKQPLGFTLAASSSVAYVYQNMETLLTCTWGAVMKVSKSAGPVFSPLVFDWNGALFGVMGVSLVRIDPSSANTTVLSTNVYDGAMVGMFGTQAQLFTMTESGLFQFKQRILAYPSNRLAAVSPATFRVTSVARTPLSSGLFPVVFRNTTYPDVRNGWAYGLLDPYSGTVKMMHPFGRDLNWLLPLIVQGNTAFLVQLQGATSVFSFDLETYNQGPVVAIQDLDQSNVLLDLQSSTFVTNKHH